MRPLVVVAVVACTPSAPDAPSWQRDVMPIVAANCLRCHGYPAIGGAPAYFRLDSFDPVAVADDPAIPPIDGAAAVAQVIGSMVDSGAMPPRFPIEDHQIDTLVSWATTDPPQRGAPHPDNRAPAITVTELDRDAAVVHLEYDLGDDDRDLVVGQLRAVGVVDRLIAPVQSGRIEIYWNTAGLPAGDYELQARLDDGAGPSVVVAGTLAIGAP